MSSAKALQKTLKAPAQFRGVASALSLTIGRDAELATGGVPALPFTIAASGAATGVCGGLNPPNNSWTVTGVYVKRTGARTDP